MGIRVDTASIPLEPWQGPAIMLVDLDAFFASVEQLDHPAWRGKPVIVGGDADKHGVVSTCSYEARKFGVRSAMAASLARELCPHAIWTHGHYDRYREMSNAIMDILRDETPHVQQVSIDEAFIDVSPTKTNTEHPVRVARRIQERVEQLGVTCSIGLGTTKSVAKIASDMDKPRGLTVVYPGGERTFLNPLPIRIMSGIGPVAEKTLVSLGVRTLHDLAEADESILRRAFGKNASMMRARALGCDDSPIITEEPVKSVSNEITFSTDLETRADIEAALSTIAAKVGRRLRQKELEGRTLSVKVRFDDRSTKSAQCQLVRATNDELVFGPRAHELVAGLWRPGLKVRLLGIGISGFEKEGFVQEALFDLAPEALGEAADGTKRTPDGATRASGGTRRTGTQDRRDAAGINARDFDFGKRAPGEGASTHTLSVGEKLDPNQRRKLLAATDALKDRFGETAVRFGHELRNEGNTTGSGSKNPADYK